MAEITPIDILSYENFLPNQYSNSVDTKKLLAIYLQQVQYLEDANVELSEVSTSIPLAGGYQLDIIGKLVGCPRSGLSDEEYREKILFRISVNVGHGTPEDMIQYLKAVTNPIHTKYWEHYPASVIMESKSDTVPFNITSSLDNIAPAGVRTGAVIHSGLPHYFRNAELQEPFPNYVEDLDTLLTLCGEPLMECGELSAEATSAPLPYFTAVDEDSIIYDAIRPELTDSYIPTINTCGEPHMECGELEAFCEISSLVAISTRGALAEVTPIDALLSTSNLNLAGETLMLCGEPLAQCEGLE